MKRLIVISLLLLAGCVPEEVHQERIETDQARIQELQVQTAELQNALSSTSATVRSLELAVMVNGLLLAICLAVLWIRSKRKEATSG